MAFGNIWPGCQWHCASRILFAGEVGETACCIPCRKPIKASRMALYPLEWREMLPAVLVTVRQRLTPLAWPSFRVPLMASLPSQGSLNLHHFGVVAYLWPLAVCATYTPWPGSIGLPREEQNRTLPPPQLHSRERLASPPTSPGLPNGRTVPAARHCSTLGSELFTAEATIVCLPGL